jgi:phospholipase/carboxylesterase
MNRIQLLARPSQDELYKQQVDEAIERVENGTATVEAARYSHGSAEHCAVFAPLHYEPNYAYPLVVWLHGPDDNETQLRRIMPLISLRNYVAVSPRGTLETRRSDSGKVGYTWRQSEPDVVAAEQRVFDSIALAEKKFNIGQRRIFLAGYDCGGTMAFRIAHNHPQRFAGIVSLGGAFPSDRAPLRRLVEARRLPVFLTCGRDSLKYPSDKVCENLRLFHTAGIDISLRQYPCGQEITTNMLSDLDRWMMDLVAKSS